MSPQNAVIFGSGSAGYILFKSLSKISNVAQEREILVKWINFFHWHKLKSLKISSHCGEGGEYGGEGEAFQDYNKMLKKMILR